MGIGKTNVGGGKKTFAFIVVTYPAGSVCTCTDGTRTLRAKGTTGSYVFNVPYAATWIVSCTDGTHTTSQSVVVNSQTAYNVSLSYRIVLYDYGTENVGFANAKYTNQTKIGLYDTYSDHFYLHTDGHADISIARRTVEKIDISQFTTLKVYGHAVGDARNARRAFVSKEDPAYEVSSTVYTEFSGTMEYQTLDIGSLTGEYYVGVGVTENSVVSMTGIDVYEIVLE